MLPNSSWIGHSWAEREKVETFGNRGLNQGLPGNIGLIRFFPGYIRVHQVISVFPGYYRVHQVISDFSRLLKSPPVYIRFYQIISESTSLYQNFPDYNKVQMVINGYKYFPDFNRSQHIWGYLLQVWWVHWLGENAPNLNDFHQFITTEEGFQQIFNFWCCKISLTFVTQNTMIMVMVHSL